MKIDRSAGIVLASALLTLGSLSFVFCPTARAGGEKAPVSAPAAAVADDDGDGDELLEHWNDPLFAAEERRQIVGLAVLLTGTGAFAVRRRQRLRRERLQA